MTEVKVLDLAQVFDDERQRVVRFSDLHLKLTYLYDNTYTGTTEYVPFKNTLYYVDAEQSYVSTDMERISTIL
jgi:hypothetical protein